MTNPYYFTERPIQFGKNFTVESHHINHNNSKTTIKPTYKDLGVETRYNNKLLKENTTIYARLINQYIIKNQTLYPASFDEEDEDKQLLDETDLFKTLCTNQTLPECDINKNDVNSSSEYQIRKQELKDSG